METKEDKHKRHEYYFQKLIECCKEGDLVQVAAYVKLGYSIKLKNNLAIATVAKYGHVEILKYLFSKSMTEEDIYTSVSIASEHGRLSIIEYLYPKNKINKELIKNSLIKGIQNNQFPIIKYWKSKDKLQEEDNIMLLEIVVFNNNVQALNFLVKEIEVDIFPYKNKVYQLAKSNNCHNIIEYLKSLDDMDLSLEENHSNYSTMYDQSIQNNSFKIK